MSTRDWFTFLLIMDVMAWIGLTMAFLTSDDFMLSDKDDARMALGLLLFGWLFGPIVIVCLPFAIVGGTGYLLFRLLRSAQLLLLSSRPQLTCDNESASGDLTIATSADGQLSLPFSE